MVRNPFRLAYALLAAIVAAGGVLFYAEAAPVIHPRSQCTAAGASHDPLVATRQFVETAVAPRSRCANHPRLRPRQPAWIACECGSWLGASDPETRQHYQMGH